VAGDSETVAAKRAFRVANHDSAMLEVHEAQERILDAVSVLGAVETPLDASLGRVLADDIASTLNLPLWDNSAMDGYAVRAEDVASASRTHPIRLRVLEHIGAGAMPRQRITPGGASRIFTGAPMPDGADAVVMQEDTDQGRETVAVFDPVRIGENVRRAGEDIREGESVLRAGTRIEPTHLSLLATLGQARVRVRRAPRVAILATGEELIEADQPLTTGKLREGNSHLLAGFVRQLGFEPTRLGIARDDRADLRAKLSEGLGYDALITSGGVSVGEHDLVKAVLEEIGCPIQFWKVGVKPGKPFLFSRTPSCMVFGLPGNPVSTMVTFLLFVRPALLKMAGRRDLALPRRRAVAATEFRNKGARRHFLRGVLSEADGRLEVASAGRQESHALGSMARANCLVDLPPDTSVQAGQSVEVLTWN
jgi:molybdopterin molybdotransferase